MSTYSTPTVSSTTTSTISTPTVPMATNPKMKVEEYTNPEAHFSATTAPLTSHMIIDAFEDRFNIHCPEMTFFQNSLTVTHRKHNISLVFSTPEAILGTIYQQPPTPIPSISQATTTDGSPLKQLDHSDPILFIPKPVQVQASAQWQKHLAKRPSNEDKPLFEEVNKTVGDWTYSTLYQGQLYINHHNNTTAEDITPITTNGDESPTDINKSNIPATTTENTTNNTSNTAATLTTLQLNTTADHFEGFFTPQFPFTPAKLHNTLTPDANPNSPKSPVFEPTTAAVLCGANNNTTMTATQSSPNNPSPPAQTSTIGQKKWGSPISSQSSPLPLGPETSDPATSPFLQHLSQLIPKYDILTQQTNPDQVLANIPRPELSQFGLDEVNNDLWQETSVGIDYKLLSSKIEKIEFYSHIILFEDELHDNGSSNYTIRIRVMNSCYYILVRNFLRVDDVVVRIRDTRYFYPFHQHTKSLHLLSPVSQPQHHIHHTADTPSATPSPTQQPTKTDYTTIHDNDGQQQLPPDWLYRETKVQEATFEQLRQMKKSTHSKDYTEEFSWVTLPTLYFANHRIDLNTIRPLLGT